MSLVAKLASTKERVYAPDFKSGHEIRSKYRHGDLTCGCPDCGALVFPRDRKGFALHFVHQRNCESQFNYHPVSPEHERGKELIRELFTAELADYSDVKVEFELPVKEANRIADVAIVYPTGYLLIGECQLASITTTELEARTNDYESAGADVIWWLGKDADTAANRTWCIDQFGECRIINYQHLLDERRTNHLKQVGGERVAS